MPGTIRGKSMQAEVAFDLAKVAPAVGGSIVAIAGVPISEIAGVATTMYAVTMLAHHVVTKYAIPVYRRWRACRVRKARKQ